MPQKIRLTSDYDCEPIWGNGDALDPDELGLKNITISRLSKWQADYDATLDLEEPYNTGFKTLEARKAFEQEGLEIAEQMQSELGDGYEIYYRNERVKIPVQT